MSKDNFVVIIEEGRTFSPYYFYTEFLDRLVSWIKSHEDEIKSIGYRLTDNQDLIGGRYRIDPISLPLLLSLSQQLKRNKGSKIELNLSNYSATSNLLAFLYRSDFFDVAGERGEDLLSFDERYIGGFPLRSIRSEHKIRCYTKKDIPFEISDTVTDDERNRCVEEYSYKVYNHFAPILQEIQNKQDISLYAEILSELITNGIVHSKSDVFALMFSDRYAMKFSISDNGIGFAASLKNKENDTLKELKEELYKKAKRNPDDDPRIDAMVAIFEALFYSMVKERLGLFDLMINVVNHYYGYFRIHDSCSQIIFSARLGMELEGLENIRNNIRKNYIDKIFNGSITDKEFEEKKKYQVKEGYKLFVNLFQNTLEQYSKDVIFSSIRMFNVRFKGVHIEVEIPKND